MRNIGIYYAYWTREWEADFLPFVKKVKNLGFDQLEVNGGTVASMKESETLRLVDEAKEHGICLSYGIGLTREHDVSSLDEATRKRGVEFMRTMIQSIGTMGGGMLGGTIHSYWPAEPPESISQKMKIRDQSIKSMKELVRYAEDNGVILNVEVINRFEQFLINTCKEAVEYVSEVNSPNCKILLDTFHMNIEEDSFYDAIKLAQTHLSALHIGETNRKPPGTGRVPWNEIRRALDEISFDGPLVMEPFIVPGGQVGKDIGIWREIMPGIDPDEAVRKSVEFVRDKLA